jgi:hypothetical protein
MLRQQSLIILQSNVWSNRRSILKRWKNSLLGNILILYFKEEWWKKMENKLERRTFIREELSNWTQSL